MKLIRIDEFAARYFDESCRPDPRTVRYWCENGHLPARRIGKPWYVDVDKFEQTHDAVLMDRIRGSNHAQTSKQKKSRPAAPSLPVPGR